MYLLAVTIPVEEHYFVGVMNNFSSYFRSFLYVQVPSLLLLQAVNLKTTKVQVHHQVG